MGSDDFVGDALEAGQSVLQLATCLPVKITQPRHIWPHCIVLGEGEIEKETIKTIKEGYGGQALSREAVKKN